MIWINKELIQKELQSDIDNGFQFTHKKLSNRFLDWLFRHYYTVEMCENYYDSDPTEYDEWERLQSTEEGQRKYKEMVRQYEKDRIKLCTWQEPYHRGNWGITQKRVDEIARESLRNIRTSPVKKKDRIFYAENGDEIRIYFYGRDFGYVDLWFIFQKRNRK